jgi:hypothetical protein
LSLGRSHPFGLGDELGDPPGVLGGFHPGVLVHDLAVNAKQLLEELSKVYEKRILVEATEPIAP